MKRTLPAHHYHIWILHWSQLSIFAIYQSRSLTGWAPSARSTNARFVRGAWDQTKKCEFALTLHWKCLLEFTSWCRRCEWTLTHKLRLVWTHLKVFKGFKEDVKAWCHLKEQRGEAQMFALFYLHVFSNQEATLMLSLYIVKKASFPEWKKKYQNGRGSSDESRTEQN